MRRLLLPAVIAVMLGLASAAQAVDDAESVIKYRRQVMKALGAHAAAVAMVVKGEVAAAADVAAHARAIEAMAKLIPGLFPSGTDSRSLETRAKPEIWRDWKRFTVLAKEVERAGAELAEAAVTGDAAAVAARFVALAKACGGCHKPFRAKKRQ